MQRSALSRSRRELSNAYFLAKFGFDTAENEPCQVCLLSALAQIPPRCSIAALLPAVSTAATTTVALRGCGLADLDETSVGALFAALEANPSAPAALTIQNKAQKIENKMK